MLQNAPIVALAQDILAKCSLWSTSTMILRGVTCCGTPPAPNTFFTPFVRAVMDALQDLSSALCTLDECVVQLEALLGGAAGVDPPPSAPPAPHLHLLSLQLTVQVPSPSRHPSAHSSSRATWVDTRVCLGWPSFGTTSRCVCVFICQPGVFAGCVARPSLTPSQGRGVL